MTFEEFKTNVRNWSAERGIYEHSTALAQALKAVSEVGELCDGVIKNDIDEIKDAIGDVAVCLVNVAEMSGLKSDFIAAKNVKSSCKVSHLVSASSTSKTVADLALMIGMQSVNGYVPNQVATFSDINDQICYAIGHLKMVADDFELNFLSCCESAWTEISFRKGRMVAGGAFVKE